jgi:hypothetical protein
MDIVLAASRITCVALVIAGAYQAKGWRGIVPHHSTRADVERLIGEPNFKDHLYDFEKERVRIFYASDPCAEGPPSGGNTPRDVVTQLRVAPKEKLLLSDLQLDPSKYEKVKDGEVQVHTSYVNKEEGISYEVSEGSGEDDGEILNTRYEPAAEDKVLRCKNGGHLPAPNNGMHPTADTNTLMLRERLGAAGDAWR